MNKDREPLLESPKRRAFRALESTWAAKGGLAVDYSRGRG